MQILPTVRASVTLTVARLTIYGSTIREHANITWPASSQRQRYLPVSIIFKFTQRISFCSAYRRWLSTSTLRWSTAQIPWDLREVPSFNKLFKLTSRWVIPVFFSNIIDGWMQFFLVISIIIKCILISHAMRTTLETEFNLFQLHVMILNSVVSTTEWLISKQRHSYHTDCQEACCVIMTAHDICVVQWTWNFLKW